MKTQIVLLSFLVIPTLANSNYKVQSGDNLSNILLKMNLKPIYGKRGLIEKTVELNPGMNPDRIKVGQTIKIPIQKDEHDSLKNNCQKESLSEIENTGGSSTTTKMLKTYPYLGFSLSGEVLTTINKSNNAISKNTVGHNKIFYLEKTNQNKTMYSLDYFKLGRVNSETIKSNELFFSFKNNYIFSHGEKIDLNFATSISQNPYLDIENNNLRLKKSNLVSLGAGFDYRVSRFNIYGDYLKGIGVSDGAKLDTMSLSIENKSELMKTISFDVGYVSEKIENNKTINYDNRIQFGVKYEF